MCFGPVASFTASAFLAGIGTAVIKNIRSRKELLFAAFPMLFALQQFIEGIIWLLLKDTQSNALIRPMTLAYLFFAYSLWPVLCPLSVYMIESDPKRKTILRIMTSIGVLTSLYLLFHITHNPTMTSVLGCSIRYQTFVPEARWFAASYIAAAILPYFISSHRSVLYFGLPNLLFCVLAYVLYEKSFISAWCFFAALISANLYFSLRKLHHQPVLPGFAAKP